MNPSRSVLIALIVVALFALPAVADAGQKPPPTQDLQAQINALAARVSSLEGQVSALQTTVSTQATQITALQGNVTTLETAVGLLQADLSNVKDSGVMALNPYLTVSTETSGPLVRFSGVNVQIVNGTGQTYGPPNGLGNLVIGYNMIRPPIRENIPSCSDGRWSFPQEEECIANGGVYGINHKSGSHNLIVGDEHNYSQAGGTAFGYHNTINRQGAAVTGGYWNMASGENAAVQGGYNNNASGYLATVGGGSGNRATNTATSVSGGQGRSANGVNNWAAGGLLQVE